MRRFVYILILFNIAIAGGCAKKNYMDNIQTTLPKTFNSIRKPAVAGSFYPENSQDLQKKIYKYLEKAKPVAKGKNVRAIMVPHAGYDYSGQVAAYGYKLLSGRKVNTVVIISNSHSAYFDGLAIDNNEAWQTPLGIVALDLDFADKLVNVDNLIYFNKEAHTEDHTLEVQLPFLQTVLGANFKILPILFGNTNDKAYEKLAQALNKYLTDDDIVVVSTDMSHYPSYEDANIIDNKTLDFVKKFDQLGLEAHIADTMNKKVSNEQTLCCGIDGVKTVLELSKLAGWQTAQILKYANSGDVLIGDKNRVVGYGAVAFWGEEEEGEEINGQAKANLDQKQKTILLDIAKKSVEAQVRGAEMKTINIKDERLNWKEGAFVTLKKNGELRGCIGQIMPSGKPLWEVVQNMGEAACSQDHRFNPVSENELEDIEYEISVLSTPVKVDDWNDIILGKHGVIVKKGFRSGVFLPQVADETGWSKEEFLGELCSQKAGLEPDCYKNKSVELQVFTAQVFK